MHHNNRAPTKLEGKIVSFQVVNNDQLSLSYNTATNASSVLPQVEEWKIVPGLCGEGISLESTSHPGRYLRHRYLWFFADSIEHVVEDINLFKKDACFKPIPGLSNCAHLTFESVNYPEHYMYYDSNINFRVKLAWNGSSFQYWRSYIQNWYDTLFSA